MFSFFNKNISLINNPDLALKLFETLSVFTGMLTGNEKRIIDDILRTCKDRQEVFVQIVEKKSMLQKIVFAQNVVYK